MPASSKTQQPQKHKEQQKPNKRQKSTLRKQACGRVHHPGVKCAACVVRSVQRSGQTWEEYEKKCIRLGRPCPRRSKGGYFPRKRPMSNEARKLAATAAKAKSTSA